MRSITENIGTKLKKQLKLEAEYNLFLNRERSTMGWLAVASIRMKSIKNIANVIKRAIIVNEAQPRSCPSVIPSIKDVTLMNMKAAP